MSGKIEGTIVSVSEDGDLITDIEYPSWNSAPSDSALRIIVDACSVEVFSGDGLAVITELVFPAPGATGVRLASRGGPARLLSFQAWPLRSAHTSRIA